MFNHVRRRLLRHQPYLLVDARDGPTVLFLRPRLLQRHRRAVAVPVVGLRTAFRMTVILETNIIRRRGSNAAGSAHRHLTDQLKSFATFRAQFDNAAAFNRWSEYVQLAYLKSCLASVAAQSLWDTPKDQTNTLDKL